MQRARTDGNRIWILVGALFCLTLVGSVIAAAPSEFLGQSLADALAVLESRGLRIVFSDDLVRPGMIVSVEPQPGTIRELLNQLLRPHGLDSRDGPAGSVLVVRARVDGELRGVVRDRQSAWPLAGARVVVAGERVTTNEDGTFRLRLSPGHYVVEAVRSGYYAAALGSIEVPEDEIVQVSLDLTPMSVSIEEVVVSSTDARSGKRTTTSRVTLNEDAVTNAPILADDALRIIDRLPGVVAREESAAPNIRGGVSDETLILLDGMELYEPFHLRDVRGFTSIIDSRIVSGLNYFNGGFPSEYGGRMSGVLDITSRTPAERSSYGVGLGSEHAWFSGEGRSVEGRVRWLAAARAGFPKETLERLGAGPEARSSYYDLYTKVGFDVSPRASLTFHLLAANDELRRPTSSDDDLEPTDSYGSRYRSRYSWLSLRQNWSPGLISRTTLAVSKLSRLRDGQASMISIRDERNTTVQEIKQDWILVTPNHTLKGGWGIKDLRTSYDYQSLVLSLSGTPDGTDTALYLSDHVRVGPSFDVEFGLRADRQDYAENEDRTLSPRFNVSYRPGPKDAIRVGWGRFFQPQRINELQIEDGVDSFFRAKRSDQMVVDYDHDFAGGMQLRVGAYRNRITRLHPRFENLFDPLGVIPEAAADRVRVDADLATARGVELHLRGKNRRRWSWTGGYTFASAKDRIDGVKVPRAWDQRHTLTGELGLKLKRWQFNVVESLRTGRPTTPVTAERVNLPGGGQEIVSTVGERNSRRFPTYNRLDVKVRRHFPTERGGFELWLQVINLINRGNSCCVKEFDFDINDDGSVDVETIRRDGLERVVTGGAAWTF